MSSSNIEIKKLRETLRLFHEAQETADEKLFLQVWHPEARRFGFGSDDKLYIFSTEDILTNQFQGIKQAKKDNPDYSLSFFIKRIRHIDMDPDKLIALAVVEWQMVSMGRAVGVHYTYYHFVKSNGKWVIVNVTDRGKDVQ
jgi:hypothetical protein